MVVIIILSMYLILKEIKFHIKFTFKYFINTKNLDKISYNGNVYPELYKISESIILEPNFLCCKCKNRLTLNSSTFQCIE